MSVADQDNNYRILVVEDDVDLAEMLNDFFRDQGYQVDVAIWGEDALRLAQENPPHLVLLDIRLPDFDGYEVCRRLRQMHRTRAIPVIFLTEKRERDDKLAGLELGAVDYITKPFDMKELHLRMRNTLRRVDLKTQNNAVTGLPEGDLVEHQLMSMLERPTWGVVYAGINDLSRFRDKYGFVAADDVTRAISLILNNAIEEAGLPNPFIGHVDNIAFIIITQSDRCQNLAHNCRERLESAIPYFYPANEMFTNPDQMKREMLTVDIQCLTAQDAVITTLEELQTALANVPQPHG